VKRVATFALMSAVKLYRGVVAPWLPPSCRFTPSCSAYMLEALRTHGPIKGLLMGLRRVGRCSPLTPSGFDPVPPKSADDAAR
jgi:uncharacterized protein